MLMIMKLKVKWDDEVGGGGQKSKKIDDIGIDSLALRSRFSNNIYILFDIDIKFFGWLLF